MRQKFELMRRYAWLLLPLVGLISNVANADDFRERVAALATDDFDELAVAVNKLAATGNARAGAVLNALVNGDLYTWPRTKGPVISKAKGDELDFNYVTNTLPIQIHDLTAQLKSGRRGGAHWTLCGCSDD